jgi:mannose-6-phosphate isomerase-like protein (cupin superfamily)
VSGAGARYVEHDRTADLSVGCYVPDAGAIDEQVPHTEDEVYVVVSGSATLWTPDAALPARPGDVLLVPAGLDHRFVEVGDDFRVVVVFGPAEYTRGSRESS